MTDAERTKLKVIILRTFEVYPKLSVSMVAAHIRPYHTQWKEVFEEMIADGIIKRQTVIRNSRALLVHELV